MFYYGKSHGLVGNPIRTRYSHADEPSSSSSSSSSSFFFFFLCFFFLLFFSFLGSSTSSWGFVFRLILLFSERMIGILSRFFKLWWDFSDQMQQLLLDPSKNKKNLFEGSRDSLRFLAGFSQRQFPMARTSLKRSKRTPNNLKSSRKREDYPHQSPIEALMSIPTNPRGRIFQQFDPSCRQTSRNLQNDIKESSQKNPKKSLISLVRNGLDSLLFRLFGAPLSSPSLPSFPHLSSSSFSSSSSSSSSSRFLVWALFFGELKNWGKSKWMVCLSALGILSF